MKRLLLGAWLTLLAFAALAGPIMFGSQATKAVSVVATTAAVALPTLGAGELRQIELTNGGTLTVFVEFGDSTVTAVIPTGTANAYPILAGQTKVVTVKPTTTHIAAIATGAGPTTLYVTVGIGE